MSDMVWGLEIFNICNGELLNTVEYGAGSRFLSGYKYGSNHKIALGLLLHTHRCCIPGSLEPRGIKL